MSELPGGIKLIPDKTIELLNPRQLNSYREHRREFFKEMLECE